MSDNEITVSILLSLPPNVPKQNTYIFVRIVLQLTRSIRLRLLLKNVYYRF